MKLGQNINIMGNDFLADVWNLNNLAQNKMNFNLQGSQEFFAVNDTQSLTPYGKLMAGMQYAKSGEHGYGFNGMEKSPEISPNNYTAEFWEYDSDEAIRWNPDPRPNPSFGYYTTFANNPIMFSDPMGDSVFAYGDDAESVVKDLQQSSKALEFDLDKNNSQITIKNLDKIKREDLTKDDQVVYDAVTDTKNNVNIFADSKFLFVNKNGTDHVIDMGAFGGSAQAIDGTNEAFQYIHYPSAENLMSQGGLPRGTFVKHELMEAYLGVTLYPNDFDKSHFESNLLFPIIPYTFDGSVKKHSTKLTAKNGIDKKEYDILDRRNIWDEKDKRFNMSSYSKNLMLNYITQKRKKD